MVAPPTEAVLSAARKSARNKLEAASVYITNCYKAKVGRPRPTPPSASTVNATFPRSGSFHVLANGVLSCRASDWICTAKRLAIKLPAFLFPGLTSVGSGQDINVMHHASWTTSMQSLTQEQSALAVLRPLRYHRADSV